MKRISSEKKSVVKESNKNSKTKTYHADIKSTMLRNKWAQQIGDDKESVKTFL